MKNIEGKKQHTLGIVLMAVATIFWGAGFVLNAQLSASSFNHAPALLNGVRFGVSVFVLLAIFNKRIQFNKHVLIYGAVGGAFLFGGFMLQTLAFSYTTPAHDGFFTAGYIIFVPLLVWIITKKTPSWITLVGIAVAICGLFLLNFEQGTLPVGAWKGDLLALGCALCFALQIVWVDWLLEKNKTDNVQLAFWQVAFAALFFIAHTLIFEHKYVFNIDFDFNYCWWRLAIVTFGGTAFAYFGQCYAQKNISPAETSLLMSCESPIGAILSLLVGLDIFSWTIPIGGGLVIIAVVLVEVIPSVIAKRKMKTE